MGLTPVQLAEFTPVQFERKCKGFEDKKAEEEANFRKVAFFSMSPHVDRKKSPSFDKMWPPRGTKKLVLIKQEEIDFWREEYQRRKSLQLNTTSDANIFS